MMWLLYSFAAVLGLLVGDDVVRTCLGHDTIIGWVRRRLAIRRMRRQFAEAQALAAKVDPARRGLVLRSG